MTAFIKPAFITSLIVLAGCELAPHTSRTQSGFEASAPATPKAREGQAIVLGRDNVVRVGEMSAAQYQRHLSNLSRRFVRETRDEIYFAAGETALDDSDRDILREQALWIIAHPEAYVSVTGYANDAETTEENKALGTLRAREAVTYLVLQGVDRARLVALSSEDSSDRTGRASGRKVVTAIYELVDTRPDEATQSVDVSGTTSVPTGTTGSGTTGGGTTGGGTTGGGTTVGGRGG